MKVKFDLFIVVMIFAIFGSMAYAVITAAYGHSLIEPEKKHCRGEFGHKRPEWFCERRDASEVKECSASERTVTRCGSTRSHDDNRDNPESNHRQWST